MNTKMKPQAVAVKDPHEDAIRSLYMESLHLVERLHRRLLDVIKDEFDRSGSLATSTPSRRFSSSTSAIPN